jgi:galactose mutarotase-like enzyme
MADQSWILTDTNNNVYVDSLDIGVNDKVPNEVPGAGSDFSICKRRLRGGRQDGVDVIEVDNGAFRFIVLPTRGMGIWKAWLGDMYVGWHSPVEGPVHPAFVPLAEPSGIGWLDGFDELICRCGLESNGAPDFDESGKLKYTVHGRIANTPASRVEIAFDPDTKEITITGVVVESRFHLQQLEMTTTIRTRIGEPGLRIHDEVRNRSGDPASMQLLYHVNFGNPLLSPGSEVVLPTEQMAPRDPRAVEGLEQWNRYGEEQTSYSEQVYYFKLRSDEAGETHTLLKNPGASSGASLRFNTQQLPCFAVWKNQRSQADGYVTGLEPATNYPNTRTYEEQQDRVVSLSAGESVAFDLTLEVHADADSVAQAEQHIRELAGNEPPTLFAEPQVGWSV